MTNNPSLPSGKPSTAWYYAGEDGKIYVNGWYEINGKTYYFYAGGNAAVNSNFVLDGKRYYVDEKMCIRDRYNIGGTFNSMIMNLSTSISGVLAPVSYTHLQELFTAHMHFDLPIMIHFRIQ